MLKGYILHAGCYPFCARSGEYSVQEYATYNIAQRAQWSGVCNILHKPESAGIHRYFT